MKTTTSKSRVPRILPREPLTKKAYKAIEVYAVFRCKGLRVYPLLIKYCLEAERMRRVDLYEYLEKHGYRWKSLPGGPAYWVDKEGHYAG